MKISINSALVAGLLSSAAVAGFAQENAIIPESLLTQNPETEAPNAVPPQAAYENPVEEPANADAPASVMPLTVRVPLSFKEQHGVDLATAWKDRPEIPREGPDGAVTYLFGASMPTLVCTPLEICTIALEQGEVVSEDGVHVGDTVRWKISPSTVGTDDKITTYVIVKPREPGLDTNLFIATDRRAYVVKLLSHDKEWMPILNFDYPSKDGADWAAYRKRVEESKKPAPAKRTAAAPTRTRKSSGSSAAGQNLANLNFNYRITGDKAAWQPLRVYTDGRKTYIQFASNSFPDGAPALVAIDSGQQTMVNYRLSGDRYVVDRVLYNAELVAGTGRSQRRVKLTLTK